MENVFLTENKSLSNQFSRIPATQEFIERNKFTLQRTTEEMNNFLEVHSSFFGFEKEILLKFLPWEEAKKYFVPEYIDMVDKGVEKHEVPTDLTETVQDFLDYMVFAWGKALDERGISASRSISKLGVWLWLIGRNDLFETIRKDELYYPYGAPALIAVCKEMGINVPEEVIEFSQRKG